MYEELNTPQRRYQCRSSCYQWLAVITLLLNPPFGGISFFLCRKSRQSLLAGKMEAFFRHSHLSVVFSVCGLLCTLLIVTLLGLCLSGVLRMAPATPNFESTLMPPLKNYKNFQGRFSNAPMSNLTNNGSYLSEIF